MTPAIASALVPLLRGLDAETAHDLALRGLRLGLAGRATAPDDPRLEILALGRRFATPFGLAAGFDKNAACLAPLARLGWGFVEAGTVTPRPQAGNPRPRLFRLAEDAAVINRMGFNNAGLATTIARLAAHRAAHPHSRTPIGANIGINKDNADPERDYPALVAAVAPHADYITINVSSPNTPGLRSLQTLAALGEIVRPLLVERDARPARKPLLVKLSVDLALDDALELARGCEEWGIDGLIVANTTLSREGLRSPEALRRQEGGLSGAPVQRASTALIRAIAGATRLPIIGVGGIFSAEDAYAKIRAGAALVQLYTGFIYGGPATPGRIARELDQFLARDGFARLSDAVGADLKRGA